MTRVCWLVAFALAAIACRVTDAKQDRNQPKEDITKDTQLMQMLTEAAITEERKHTTTPYFWSWLANIWKAIVQVVNSVNNLVVQIEYGVNKLTCATGNTCTFSDAKEVVGQENCTARIRYNTETKQHKVLSVQCNGFKPKHQKKPKS